MLYNIVHDISIKQHTIYPDIDVYIWYADIKHLIYRDDKI